MSARRASLECRCGHARESHPSYVPGGDKPGFCVLCACYQYQPERPWTQLLAWFRRQPVPVTADVLRQHPVRYPDTGRAEDDDGRTQFGFRAAPYVGVPRPRTSR